MQLLLSDAAFNRVITSAGMARAKPHRIAAENHITFAETHSCVLKLARSEREAGWPTKAGRGTGSERQKSAPHLRHR